MPEALIRPALETPQPRELTQKALKRIAGRAGLSDQEDAWSEGVASVGGDVLLPLLYHKTDTILDYLREDGILVADEAQARGTVDHVPVYPREVVKRALELNASALILVHNHPSGDPTPSEADISMTCQVQDAAHALGITLHDHLIIGKSRELSFKSQGYL